MGCSTSIIRTGNQVMHIRSNKYCIITKQFRQSNSMIGKHCISYITSDNESYNHYEYNKKDIYTVFIKNEYQICKYKGPVKSPWEIKDDPDQIYNTINGIFDIGDIVKSRFTGKMGCVTDILDVDKVKIALNFKGRNDDDIIRYAALVK